MNKNKSHDGTKRESSPRSSSPAQRGSRRPACRVCAHERRASIEATALNGMSLSHNAAAISQAFGIRVSERQLETHMTGHLDSATVATRALLLDSAAGTDEGPNPTGIINVLVEEACQRAERGEIRIETVADLASILKVREEPCGMTPLDAVSDGYEDASAERGYYQLRLIMQAVRDSVPPEYLVRALTMAAARGLEEELVAIAMPGNDPVEPVAAGAEARGGWMNDTPEGSSGQDRAVEASDIVTTLLAQAQADAVAGELQAHNCKEVARLLKCRADIRKAEAAKRAAAGHADRTAEDAFRNLGYIMTALRGTVPDEYLEESIKTAWGLGLGRRVESLRDVPLYQMDPPYVAVNMDLQASDMKAMAAGVRPGLRSREEVEYFYAIDILTEPEALAQIAESETHSEVRGAAAAPSRAEAAPDSDGARLSGPAGEVSPEFNNDVPPD
jgi:hypothetical protein